MEITLKQLSPDFQQIIADVGQSNKPIIITDEGTPLAILSPMPQKKRAAFGCMKETVQILDDIVAPAVPESAWEVLQ